MSETDIKTHSRHIPIETASCHPESPSPVYDPNQKASWIEKGHSLPALDIEASIQFSDFATPACSSPSTTPCMDMSKQNSFLELDEDVRRSEMSLATSKTQSLEFASNASSKESHPPRAPNPSMSTSHQVALVLVACLAQFLNLAALFQTVTPLMNLADYFSIHDYGTLSWFSAAYSLTVGTFILPAGTMPKPFWKDITCC
jgi:hypothetical protein